MQKLYQQAFALIELMLVMTIILSLAGFASVDLLKSRNRVSLDQTVQLLISDLKNQQMKMMSGNAISQTVDIPFGIRFDQSRYTLFHSSTYGINDPSNFVIDLESGTEFSTINIPNQQIVFASSSGEIQNFAPAQNTITLSNINSGEQKTITINKYGVIIQVQ